MGVKKETVGPRRRRIQADLTEADALTFEQLRQRLGGEGDTEATRRMLAILATIQARIEEGFKVAIVSRDDDHPDAVPELTRQIRPELTYEHLVARPHSWRKQLSLKGRRLTVGQLLAQIKANAWGIEEASKEFDLPVLAVTEALDYGNRFADLIAAEAAEDARAANELRAAAP